jgi:hypothetical protein
LRRDEVLTQRQETMPRSLMAARMIRCSYISPDHHSGVDDGIARAVNMGGGDAVGCKSWLLLALEFEDAAFGSMAALPCGVPHVSGRPKPGFRDAQFMPSGFRSSFVRPTTGAWRFSVPTSCRRLGGNCEKSLLCIGARGRIGKCRKC